MALTVENPLEGGLHFKFLPAYAAFLKTNHLEALVKEQLRIAREINLPFLKFLDQIPEEELVKMSLVSTGQFLDFLINNKAEEQISTAVTQWLENQLPSI